MRPFCINQNWREDPQIEGENSSFLERFKADWYKPLSCFLKSNPSVFYWRGRRVKMKKRATVTFFFPFACPPLCLETRGAVVFMSFNLA